MSDPEPPGPNPYQPPEQPQQPQNPYYAQQPPYGQQYQQPPYPQAPQGWAPPPGHPSANTSMVLGIVGLAGIATCGGITLVLSPFAWALGSKAVREIDANPAAYSGRGSAAAGKVMGIIGTILLILGILAFIALIVLLVATADSTTFDGTNA